jgi:hypothetical protein
MRKHLFICGHAGLTPSLAAAQTDPGDPAVLPPLRNSLRGSALLTDISPRPSLSAQRRSVGFAAGAAPLDQPAQAANSSRHINNSTKLSTSHLSSGSLDVACSLANHTTVNLVDGTCASPVGPVLVKGDKDATTAANPTSPSTRRAQPRKPRRRLTIGDIDGLGWME